MAKGINQLKKAKVKEGLLKGKSYRQSVKDAGYSPNSAINANRLAVVKCCLEEIEAQFTLAEVTPEMVIKQLQSTRQLATEKKDYATAAFCSTQLGKYLAMFTDKTEISQPEKEDNQFSLERLSRIKAVSLQ